MATSTSTGPSTSPKNTAAFTRHATPLASSRHPHKSLQWTCTQRSFEVLAFAAGASTQRLHRARVTLASVQRFYYGRNPDPLHTESTTAVRGGSKTIGGRPLR